jgi:hypothetical protein
MVWPESFRQVAARGLAMDEIGRRGGCFANAASGFNRISESIMKKSSKIFAFVPGGKFRVRRRCAAKPGVSKWPDQYADFYRGEILSGPSTSIDAKCIDTTESARPSCKDEPTASLRARQSTRISLEKGCFYG